MAEILAIRNEPRLRRRTGQVRFSHSAPERRKRKSGGFNIAAALELNLDRIPTKDGLLDLLHMWLRAAEREGLKTRHSDYLAAIERAFNLMSDARSAEGGIRAVQTR